MSWPVRIATLSKGVARHDFRNGMPFGSTYTRTGAATALTLAGSIQSFAADAPQRTDRGLALEPARTNRDFPSNMATGWNLLNATVTGGQTDPAGGATGTVVTSNGVANNGIYKAVSTTTGAVETWSICWKPGTAAYIWLDAHTGFVDQQVYFDAVTGTQAGSTPGGVTVGPLVVLANGYFRRLITRTATVTSTTYDVFGVSDTSSSPAAVAGKNATFAFPQTEIGNFATSIIVTTGSAATRGLPVFTAPVPVNRTQALLTYADASTTLVTGLTPGGTLDVASAVIGAGKGLFGASELVTMEWRS